MLSVVMMSVVKLNFVMLNVTMLSVVTLSVILLSVVATQSQPLKGFFSQTFFVSKIFKEWLTFFRISSKKKKF